MLIELTDNYQPERILHRDYQINSIKNVFKNFKEQGHAQNLIVFGVTGSGKTTTIKKIICDEDNHYFGSGAITNTSFKTLKSMFDLNCNTYEKLLKDIILKLKEEPGIIIIDELNKIMDIANLFNNLNTIYRETGCPLILVTNRRTIFEDIPDDARLTLFLEKVEFESYNALQLYDIIFERLDLIKDRIKVDIEKNEAGIRKICAMGGKEASARIVLNITLKCVLNNNFSLEFIDNIKENLERDSWKEFLENLRPFEKDFLKSLLDLQLRSKNIYPSDLAKDMGKGFTPARISQLISAFAGYGIIDGNCYENLGRAGGRKRVLKFSNQYIFDTLSELIQ